jgi:hypothetical protein
VRYGAITDYGAGLGNMDLAGNEGFPNKTMDEVRHQGREAFQTDEGVGAMRRTWEHNGKPQLSDRSGFSRVRFGMTITVSPLLRLEPARDP